MTTARSPAELVEPAVTGDRKAMRQLLAALGRPVLTTARRILHDRGDAEEAAQETMIALVRDLHTLREPKAVVAFARRAAARISMRHRDNRVRSERVHQAYGDQAVSPVAEADSSPAGLTARRRRLERLIDHVQSLPPEQAEAMVMQFVLGFTPSEIAAATQAPVNTVRSRVRLARQALARRLADDPEFNGDNTTARENAS